MTALALGMPGGWEWLIIGAIGLLLFGRRLPEVGRSLGRSIVEFKRGIKEVRDEIDDASTDQTGPKGHLKSGQSEPTLRQPMTPEGHDARVSQADTP